MKGPSKALAPALVATALLLLPLGTYTAGYFWLPFVGASRDGKTVVRQYRSKPLMILFTPAATMDGLVTGRDIYLDAGRLSISRREKP